MLSFCDFGENQGNTPNTFPTEHPDEVLPPKNDDLICFSAWENIQTKTREKLFEASATIIVFKIISSPADRGWIWA